MISGHINVCSNLFRINIFILRRELKFVLIYPHDILTYILHMFIFYLCQSMLSFYLISESLSNKEGLRENIKICNILFLHRAAINYLYIKITYYEIVFKYIFFRKVLQRHHLFFSHGCLQAIRYLETPKI